MTQQDMHEQNRLLQYHELKCQLLIENQTESTGDGGRRCPMVWDGAYCWPSADPGQTVYAPCPAYVHGFDPESKASKLCTSTATWWRHWKTRQAWTNYSQCAFQPKWHHPSSGMNNSLMAPHILTIKYISKVGYSFSLGTLIVAFFILASIRRLRCPRNNLHLQLFLSFIMRALMSILKDLLYRNGMHDPGPKTNDEGIESALDLDNLDSTQSVECRVFTSCWHYFLIANYAWILMEGLYLHNLIFLSMFSDTSSIIKYICAGWGFPVVVVVLWVGVRTSLENTLCWTTNQHPGYFWIIRGPITFSIILNFALFLNITRVLFSKMFSQHTPSSRQCRYRKWFKSTLVLVPLFGVHYALLLAMSFVAGVNELVEIVWLYVDLLFSSFQGALVAFLYCFLNGEVQSELRRSCSPLLPLLRKSVRGGRYFHDSQSTSGNTQSFSLLSRTGRGSAVSLHSNRSGEEIKTFHVRSTSTRRRTDQDTSEEEILKRSIKDSQL